jgi:hypothetical protein
VRGKAQVGEEGKGVFVGLRREAERRAVDGEGWKKLIMVLN